MELTDIIPQPSSFTLRRTGITYHLRECTVEDESWMAKTFGDKLDMIFRTNDMGELSRIIFRLMRVEDQQKFSPQKLTIVNEEGETSETVLGGAKLLRTLISGVNEKVEITRSLMETIGISRAIQEKFESGEITEEEIRKLQSLKKKPQ